MLQQTPRWAARFPELGTAPIDIATFTSAERYRLEQEKVFKKTWLMVGRAEELPEPGDYKVRRLTVANTSILLMRGREGEISGFHNVCSHRANHVVAETGDETFGHSASGNVFCAFHGWVYNAKGRLVNVPQEENFLGCFDKESHGLTPVHTGIWNGFIFINLAAEPKETLEENIRQYDAHLGAYPFHEMTYQFTYAAELECNWKIAHDGFSEVYHLDTLHARTLVGSFSDQLEDVELLGDHRTSGLHLGANVAGFTDLQNVSNSHAQVSLMVEKAGTMLPPTLNPRGLGSYSFELSPLFPNSIIHVTEGIWFTHQFWPMGPTKTRWEGKYYVRRPDTNSQMWAANHAQLVTRNVWLEDAGTLETIQKGIESGAKSQMLFQDEEVLLRHQHHVLETYING